MKRQNSIKKQGGFAPLFMLLGLGAMGAITMAAADSYSAYTQRAVITTGIQLAADVKKAATVYVASTGRFPTSNAQASMPDALELGDGKVLSVEIGKEPIKGTITVTFIGDGAVSNGDKLLLTPSMMGGRVKWHCMSDTIINDLLPENCQS